MAKKLHIDKLQLEEIITFWDVLTADERNYIRNIYVVKQYRKNEIIQKEGEKPSDLMIVASGIVKVYKTGSNDRQQIVRILKTGEHFGFRAIIANQTNNTSVIAFENSIIVSIDSASFISILKNNNAFCYRFLEELAYDLAESDRRALSLTQKHIRGRLAEALITLKDNYGLEADGATINIYLSREDLANYSNMTTSNAIRTLASFVQDKMVTVDGRKIKIIDYDELKRTSRLG